MKNLFERTDLIEKFLPSGLSHSIIDNKLFEAVKAVLNDAELTESICSQISSSQQEYISNHKSSVPSVTYRNVYEESSPISDSSSSSTSAPHNLNNTDYMECFETSNFEKIGSVIYSLNQWEVIRQKYACAICQDILACPTIIANCSHTFCGECIHSYLQSCVNINEEDDTKVENLCPVCREVIVNTTFEPILHRDISNIINEMPDCPEKAEWSSRSESYFNRLLASKRERSKKRNVSNSEDEMDSNFIRIVGILAVTVIIFIVVAKSRS